MAGDFWLYKVSKEKFGETEKELKSKLSDTFEVSDQYRDESGKLIVFKVKPKRDKTPGILSGGLEFSIGEKGLGVRFVYRTLTDEDYMKLRTVVGVVATKLGLVVEDPMTGEKDIDPKEFIIEKYFDYDIAFGGVKKRVDSRFIDAMKGLK